MIDINNRKWPCVCGDRDPLSLRSSRSRLSARGRKKERKEGRKEARVSGSEQPSGAMCQCVNASEPPRHGGGDDDANEASLSFERTASVFNNKDLIFI